MDVLEGPRLKACRRFMRRSRRFSSKFCKVPVPLAKTSIAIISPCALKLFAKNSRATTSGESTVAGGPAEAVVTESVASGSVSVVGCTDDAIKEVASDEGNVVAVVFGEAGAVLFFLGLLLDIVFEVLETVEAVVFSSLETEDFSGAFSTVAGDVAPFSVIGLDTVDGTRIFCVEEVNGGGSVKITLPYPSSTTVLLQEKVAKTDNKTMSITVNAETPVILDRVITLFFLFYSFPDTSDQTRKSQRCRFMNH